MLMKVKVSEKSVAAGAKGQLAALPETQVSLNSSEVEESGLCSTGLQSRVLARYCMVAML